jgi:hypothetical protein
VTGLECQRGRELDWVAQNTRVRLGFFEPRDRKCDVTHQPRQQAAVTQRVSHAVVPLVAAGRHEGLPSPVVRFGGGEVPALKTREKLALVCTREAFVTALALGEPKQLRCE